MSKIVIDDYSSRKEIYYLLTKLHPYKRLQWLRWACNESCLLTHLDAEERSKLAWRRQYHPKVSDAMVARADRACVDSSADEKLCVEVELDYFNLIVQYSLDAEKAYRKLDKMVSSQR